MAREATGATMTEKTPVFVMLSAYHSRTHFACQHVPGRYWETFCGKPSQTLRPFLVVDLPSDNAPLCRHCAQRAAIRSVPPFEEEQP